MSPPRFLAHHFAPSDVDLHAHVHLQYPVDPLVRHPGCKAILWIFMSKILSLQDHDRFDLAGAYSTEVLVLYFTGRDVDIPSECRGR